MATYIPYQPALDPLGAAFGSGLGQGIAGAVQQYFEKKDLQSLGEWMKFNQTAQAAKPLDGAVPGMPTMEAPSLGLTPMPKMKSPFGRQLQQQITMAQMENIIPSEYKQAQIELMRAQAEAQRATAYDRLNPTPSPLSPEADRHQEALRRGFEPGTREYWNVVRDPSVQREVHDKALDAGLKPGTPEYRDFTKGPAQEDKFSMPHLVNNLGFTPQEAMTVRDIRYGLLPRATAAKGTELLAEYDRWTSLYRKARYDPIFGEQPEGLEEVAVVAQEKINELTKLMREQNIRIPQPADPAPGAPRPGSTGTAAPSPDASRSPAVMDSTPAAAEPRQAGQPVPGATQQLPGWVRMGQAMGQAMGIRELAPTVPTDSDASTLFARLTQLHRAENFPVPVPTIVLKYPALAQRLPDLTPEDRTEVLGAIKDGLSEQEILSFFR